MSSYTGFEGYTDDELVKLALARGDYLITEIAQRFETLAPAEEDNAKRLEALDDNLITDDAMTWALLGALRDADIFTADELSKIINAGEAYMSLEDSIKENTAVMRELIATLKGTAPAPASEPAEKPQPKAEKAKPAAKVETPKADAPVPAVVDRKVVTDKLVKVAKLFGRETALGYLKPYGATNLSGVPDDKLAEIEAKFDEKLAAEQVAA